MHAKEEYKLVVKPGFKVSENWVSGIYLSTVLQWRVKSIQKKTLAYHNILKKVIAFR